MRSWRGTSTSTWGSGSDTPAGRLRPVCSRADGQWVRAPCWRPPRTQGPAGFDPHSRFHTFSCPRTQALPLCPRCSPGGFHLTEVRQLYTEDHRTWVSSVIRSFLKILSDLRKVTSETGLCSETQPGCWPPQLGPPHLWAAPAPGPGPSRSRCAQGWSPVAPTKGEGSMGGRRAAQVVF